LQIRKIALPIISLGLIALAILAGAGYLVATFILKSQPTGNFASASLAIACLAGYLGATLAQEFIRDRRGQPFRLLHLRRVWLWLILAGIGLSVGVLVQQSPWAKYPLPPFHVLTLAAWACFLFSMVYSWLPRLTIRETALQVTYGAFVATSVGGLLELILLLLLGVAAVVAAALLPGGQTWLETIRNALRAPTLLRDPKHLAELLLVPPITVTLAGGLTMMVPLVEESVKSLGVLALIHHLPERNRCLAWGLLCGLGFGLGESMLSVASLGASWGVTIVARMLTMILHTLTGGLMGVGWYYAVRERRLWNLVGLYALSLALHALWNGVAVLGSLQALLLMAR